MLSTKKKVDSNNVECYFFRFGRSFRNRVTDHRCGCVLRSLRHQKEQSLTSLLTSEKTPRKKPAGMAGRHKTVNV
jgi:hypothetical protein